MLHDTPYRTSRAAILAALLLCLAFCKSEPEPPVVPRAEIAPPAPEAAPEFAAGEEEALPRVLEPEFSIESIAIRQAELINTRLKVKIRIRNPNPFPVTLDTFRYELYGGGRFWADGRRSGLCVVPGNGETEQDLFLLMNFTNMRREVLDRIIAMRSVSYRFTGDALVSADTGQFPVFTAPFDLRGDSPVIQ